MFDRSSVFTRALTAAGIGAALASTALLPSAAAAPVKAAATTKTFSVTYTQQCDIEYFGNESLTLKNAGTYPTAVTVGKAFSLTKFTGTETVSASLADAAASLGITHLVVMTTVLDFSAVNATPAVTNFDKSTVTTDVPVQQGKPIVVPYRPNNAALTASLKPTKAGAVEFQNGAGTASTSTFNAYGSDNQVILSNGTIDCSSPSPAETLFTTTASK